MFIELISEILTRQHSRIVRSWSSLKSVKSSASFQVTSHAGKQGGGRYGGMKNTGGGDTYIWFSGKVIRSLAPHTRVHILSTSSRCSRYHRFRVQGKELREQDGKRREKPQSSREREDAHSTHKWRVCRRGSRANARDVLRPRRT